VGRTRAKRLRGFGNAIVLPLATEFVSAVIDALADDADKIGTSVEVASTLAAREVA